MTKKKSERILPSKAKRAKKTSKKTAKKNMGLYTSLSYKHRAKKEASARRRAEEMAKLPKEPIKRFFLAWSKGHFEILCGLFPHPTYINWRTLSLL